MIYELDLEDNKGNITAQIEFTHKGKITTIKVYSSFADDMVTPNLGVNDKATNGLIERAQEAVDKRLIELKETVKEFDKEILTNPLFQLGETLMKRPV